MLGTEGETIKMNMAAIAFREFSIKRETWL